MIAITISSSINVNINELRIAPEMCVWGGVLGLVMISFPFFA